MGIVLHRRRFTPMVTALLPALIVATVVAGDVPHPALIPMLIAWGFAHAITAESVEAAVDPGARAIA